MLLESMFNYVFEDNDFYNLVFSKLNEKLFIDRKLKIIYKKIKEYVDEYTTRPTVKDVALLIDTDGNLTEEESTLIIEKLKEIKNIEVTENFDLMKNETEQWLLHRSCELAVLESSEILEKGLPKGQMVEIMKDAVSMSLASNLGYEYAVDAEKQYSYYTRKEEVMACGLESLDILTGGGFRRKALYLFIGKTNVGKTLWLCHTGAALVQQGFNVAYYTAEMAEEAINMRLDANILNIQMNHLNLNLEKGFYLDRVNKFIDIPERGRLFCKEYPTGFGSRDDILRNLEELKIKESFVPDAIIVDSVNIFASCRLPSSLMANTYVYQKAVCEEFRAIGVEKDVPIITATQLNRESANKSADAMDTTGTSDSWGIPATSDWMGAIIQPQELYEQNKYLLKNIKTRFSENLYKVETVGVDRSHMRLFDVDEDEKDIPIAMKDKMEYQDKMRQTTLQTEDDKVFIFDEDFS